MYRKKLLAFMLIIATAITALPVGAFAEPAVGIQEIMEADLDENNQKDISIPVQYTVDATFTVKLPSAITLANNNGSWGYSGTVGVKGDIDSGKAVEVTPAESITMYDVTNRPTDDVPAGADDQAYDHKEAKNATVAQTKQQWGMTELTADTYSNTDLTLTAGAMQSGKWKGLLNVNIFYGTDETQQAKAAGLYDAGGAFTPWDDLVSAGTVIMDGNVLKKCKSSISGEMVIPDGVTSIGDSTFAGFTGLTSITIPDSVTSIGSYAFSGCTGLTSITIPDGVTSIGENAFSYCPGLESITVAEGNTKYDSRNNCNAIIEKETNTLILGCKNTVIPDGVTGIRENAFDGCTGLTSITIPDSVTSIGSYAFSGCTGLTSITIPDGVTSIGDSTFDGCTGLTSITIPGSVTSIEDNAFQNCRSLTDITFTGTQEQWSAITKGRNWNYSVLATVVHCTDGDVTL